MIADAILNVEGDLEGSGTKVPIFKGGMAQKTGKADKLLDNGDGEVTKAVKIDEALSQEDGRKRFKELDRLIVAGLAQSLISAKALCEMEQGAYYTFGGFRTIAEYGMKIMKLAESTVHQHVNAGRVAYLIGDSTDCRVKPVNAAQLRPLLNVEDDKKVIEIWNTAETLYGEGSLTEKAVAEAKRRILKQEPTEPTIVSVEQVAKNIHKAIRRGWEDCQVERGKLLGKVLLGLKGLFDQLDYADRSPRLTAIFKRIESEDPEPAAEATDEVQPVVKSTVAVQPAVKATAEVQPTAKQEPDKGNPAKPLRGRGFWDQMNWELRNDDLADVWHKPKQTIRNMRCQLKYGPAVECDPEHYQAKLAKERAKAAGDQEVS